MDLATAPAAPTTTAATTTAPSTTAPSTTAPESTGHAGRYLEPGWITQHVFNPAMRRLTKIGISVRGSRELRIRGRVSGEWRSTPVNPLTIGGERFLVAPRGTTEWVRNLRVAGGGELRLGSQVEAFRATELDDAAKPEILREYLRRWKSEVGVFFDGITADATTEQLLAIASGYPVFVVTA